MHPIWNPQRGTLISVHKGSYYSLGWFKNVATEKINLPNGNDEDAYSNHGDGRNYGTAL